MKKNLLKLFIGLAVVSMMATSCSVLNQLMGVANLVNCSYNLKDVQNVYVAGVNVKDVTNGNISATDVLKLSAALLQKNVPLTMDVNVNVTNPTTSSAALTTMDWICEIDGKQFANGTSNKTYTINPNATTTVPLAVSTDIYSMFSKDGINALKNFVGSFQNDGTNSKVAIKIKPSVNVGGVLIPTPNYINLEKKTGSSNNNNNSNGSNGSNTNKPNTNKPKLQSM